MHLVLTLLKRWPAETGIQSMKQVFLMRFFWTLHLYIESISPFAGLRNFLFAIDTAEPLHLMSSAVDCPLPPTSLISSALHFLKHQSVHSNQQTIWSQSAQVLGAR